MARKQKLEIADDFETTMQKRALEIKKAEDEAAAKLKAQ